MYNICITMEGDKETGNKWVDGAKTGRWRHGTPERRYDGNGLEAVVKIK
jgi:hypothetical protein